MLAFIVNLVIAIAKTITAVLTGSASMTAEAAHSWSDAGNEIFLLVADRRSRKPRDKSHPMGYGREAYVWSMFAAFGLFVAGAVFSVMHGVQSLFAPEPAEDFIVAYVVLAVSFVLEGISFLQAWRQARSKAKTLDRGTLEHVSASSNPTMRAVFAEDAAALMGLAIAFLGVLIHQLTGSPVPDAVGSILVGLLLGGVAVILIDRNRRFLVGQSVQHDVEVVATELLLKRPEIDRVTYIHLEFVGPEKLYLVAAVDMKGDFTESHVAVELRRVERELEENPLIEEAVLTLSMPDEPSLATGPATS
ncbi:cation diffusion facilitator family transporter [Paenarthrobacter sp. Z7-10]|uniref:cation diffusion facilitator family transporter n=1 Tax=Paenarthrobacter sp. Z7-10 TaxID=2787635 RepID=UPI0022A8E57B|nr:cation diffusion facilitator family transporter [Paenarthrobacter sp. Z7-10]